MTSRHFRLRNSALLTRIVPVLLAVGCGSEATGPELVDTVETAPVVRQEEAFPGRTGEVRRDTFETPYGPQELDYQVIDGVSVFQGDIELGEPGPDYRSAGSSLFGRRWFYGIIPVENNAVANDPRVIAAMQHWQTRTSIRFHIGATTGARVRFVQPADPMRCSSPAGRQSNGVQDLNIGASCTIGHAIHEIGHAIGLFHEQQRMDRDNNVIVNWGCIQPGGAIQFSTLGEALNLGPYDIKSFMHYGSDYFLDTSKPGCTATLTRLDGTTFAAQRTALTGVDIAGTQSLYLPWTLKHRAVDWDGDGKSDLAVFRATTATFFVKYSGNQQAVARQLGAQDDVPVPADYDADGRGDYAVWRPSNGVWYVIQSRDNSQVEIQWGERFDVPVPGDFNGDGTTERAVWRPNEGNWYIFYRFSNTPVFQWGELGDIPVQRDYDGDRKTDLAIWRPSTGDWWIQSSLNGGYTRVQWGLPGDIPVPADYDGDGKTDRAVYRPSDGNWYVLHSLDGSQRVEQLGDEKSVPITGDFDGNGRSDFAGFRQADAHWVIVRNPGTTTDGQYGAFGDIPVP